MNKAENKELQYLAPLNGLIIAISFLTRIPIKPLSFEKQSWLWSTAFFPLVGYIIGISATIPFILSQPYYMELKTGIRFGLGNGITFELATPFLYLVISYWLNKMVYFAGFCRCFNGLSTITDDIEKRLEIMKQPCVGPSAIGASIILLFGKGLMVFILVWLHGSAIVYNKSTTTIIIYLISAPVIGRLSILLIAYKANYTQLQEGVNTIIGKIKYAPLALALLSTIPLFYFFNTQTIEVTLCMAAMSVFHWRKVANENFGGVTSDVLGACCETTEVMVLFGFVLVS